MPDNPLSLELLDNQTAYCPGEVIAGVAGWEFTKPVRRIAVHLCWHTEGRGTEDASIVETIEFDAPPTVGAQPFRFSAPEGPYSYDGRLIAIRWAVELAAVGENALARIAITISPTREPFVLPAH